MLAPLQLTQASMEDCAGLMQYFDSLQELTDWGGEGFQFPPRRLQFLQQLYKSDSQGFILSQQQEMVAFGQICQRFGKHHLARLLVLPQYRGQGLSQSLLASLVIQGFEQNPQQDFSLFVFKHNQVAIHCYQRFGFVEAPQPGTPHPGLRFMQFDREQAKLLRQQQSAMPSTVATLPR